MNEMIDTAPAPEAADKVMPRDRPEPSPARAAMVKQWLGQIEEARKHWDKDFKRMRRNQKFANGQQWPSQSENDERFLVNLVQRVIKSTVAALYAKNPTVTVTKRPKIDFTVWDGRPETAIQAQQVITMAGASAGMPVTNPVQDQAQAAAVQSAMAILQDIKQGIERRQMMDKIGKTLVACLNYYIDEQTPTFKLQMKQMMRRARTCGVGYVSLGFQRDMDLSEAQTGALRDMAERLAKIGQLQADIADGEIQPDSAEAEELRLAIEAIQNEPEMIVREGLVFGFPHSTRLIPSITTEKLMGWVGCEWIAEEIMLTPDRIKQVYGVDVGKSYKAYKVQAGSPQTGDNRRVADQSKGGLACVYRLFDKSTGMEMVLCEGYPDFLREPASPQIFIEQFFPYFAVTFNDAEDEGSLFPKSDVELLTHVQKEYNRSKEALRQHRIANRPLYVSPSGSFEEEEVKSLTGYPAHAVIQLTGLEKGRPASDVLQPVQKIGVDPNLYETAGLFEDMQRVTGNAEANLGGTSDTSATQSSIAESSRQGVIGLDSDDLDEMLTALFRAAGSVMLTELDEDTVKGIAGTGAVWPTLSRAEVAKDLWLEVKAGSSGRPNQAREAATFERIYPLLVQVPGISPRWLAERAVRIADDDVDFEDAIIDGLPSIMAQNAVKQLPTGDPATDPNQQGGNATAPGQPSQAGGTSSPQYPGAAVGGALQ